jgi:hypothetical protein
MSLVKLKDSAGKTIYVNSDLVVLVTPATKDNVALLGQSAVVMLNGVPLGIDGSPDEVADQLNGREKSSLI